MAEPFLGEIKMFGGNFAPRSWALCDGQLLAISQNSALFSILGTTYGGDGRTTFGLPDLRGRMAMHAGNGPGLTPSNLGAKLGAETVTLNTSELPSHNHLINTGSLSIGATDEAADTTTPSTGSVLGTGENIYTSGPGDPTKLLGDTISGNSANTGGGQSHTNIQPYLAVNFIIAIQGRFPSRN